ncbi:hypothetical protein [Flavobacterium sp.]|uniref:hypothetical protein n=1 Tax=Flavobacterium sp. TaxID=239 RepID=UPI0038FC82A9
MNLQLLNIDGKTILPIVLYGDNRAGRENKVLQYNHKVMAEKFGLPMNYLKMPFPGVSHGQCMNWIINQTIDSIKPDFYWFNDIDCIILKKQTVDIFFNLVKDKMGIAGHCQQSNHKKNKITNSTIHCFPSQAFLWFSSEWYNKIGRPNMDHYSDESDDFGGDTAELLAYKTKESGGIVSVIYPSHVIDPFSPVDSGLFFGRGNTFGNNLLYHQMRGDLEISEDEFINICKKVLAGEFESN